MKGLLGFLGMTVGGWIGWELGAFISFYTAFMVSIVGTGLGLWMANRVSRSLLP